MLENDKPIVAGDWTNSEVDLINDKVLCKVTVIIMLDWHDVCVFGGGRGNIPCLVVCMRFSSPSLL